MFDGVTLVGGLVVGCLLGWVAASHLEWRRGYIQGLRDGGAVVGDLVLSQMAAVTAGTLTREEAAEQILNACHNAKKATDLTEDDLRPPEDARG